MDWWIIVGVGVAILALAVVPGIWLYFPKRSDPLCRSDLGIALMAGAFVAFAVLGLQVMVDQRVTRVEEDRARQEERQSLELQLALSTEALPRISLRGRDLSYFYLYRKEFAEGVFDDANLEGVNLTEAVLDGAKLNRAMLERAHLDGTSLVEAELKDAKLRGANLTNAQLKDAELDRATLTGADFSGADMTGAFLTGAVTAGSGRRTQMTSTNLTRADLTNADLSRVYFELPTLNGARFNANTVWPEGFKDRWKCEPGKVCTIKQKGPILS
jgi:uncharacterized protein YjbI with pentapeptide repeats